MEENPYQPPIIPRDKPSPVPASLGVSVFVIFPVVGVTAGVIFFVLRIIEFANPGVAAGLCGLGGLLVYSLGRMIRASRFDSGRSN
jgi:hypothetical protein